LIPKTIPRILEGINFVNPERFLIKGVISQSKTDEKAEEENKYFFSFGVTPIKHVDAHVIALLFGQCKR
jgi:hypothetical protein